MTTVIAIPVLYPRRLPDPMQHMCTPPSPHPAHIYKNPSFRGLDAQMKPIQSNSYTKKVVHYLRYLGPNGSIHLNWFALITPQ